MQLPDVNIYGTTFFDHGSTYLGLLQDAFFVISYLSLNWGLFQGGAQKAFGISAKTQCLYALAYTFRLVEYYPYDHWSYDLLKCIVFSIFLWFSFASINFFSPGCDHDCNKVDTFWLHFTVGLTSVIAYAKGYDHLPTTGRIYFWAWCNYLEGVAILPQMWLLLNFKRRDLISKGIWLGLHFMAVSRVFQLLHWTFLHYDQEMLDKVAVASAVFHVAVYFLFQITLILKDTIKSKPEMTLPVTEPSDGDTLSS